MNLTSIQCKNAKAIDKPLKLTDGGGMYLHVLPSGSKKWRLKYRYNQKEKLLTLGTYPRTGLKEAREKREEARKLIDEGQDPGEVRKQEKLTKEIEAANTFEAVAREWHEQKKHSWKPKHAATIMTRFETHLFPSLGNRPISQIKAPELLKTLRAIEAQDKLDLAHRQLQHAGQIFRYAIATGRAEVDVAANLKGALKPVVSKGHAHLTEKELPNFLRKLDKYDSEFGGAALTKLGFKLLILTFLRSGEIRGAKWEEINWEKKEWHVPAERMKMDMKHIVPLAKQSIALLKQIHKITGDNNKGYILPSQKDPRKIMSENTFLRVIDVMGLKGKTTAHGFRTTASTILNENSFNRDWIERQLSHCERDQIRAAYNYAEYLPQRHKMMQWWADYLENLTRRK